MYKKTEKIHANNDTPMITRIFPMKLFIVIKDTLMFHQWLKMEKFPKSDFEIKTNTDACQKLP